MKKSFILLLLACVQFSAQASSFWSISNEAKVPVAGPQLILPQKAFLAKLAVNEFHSFQALIPLEDAGNFPILELPTPQGTLKQFYIFNNPMMAPALAARYPEIQTYTLVDVQNPTITGKADFTYWGFHAKIFAGDHTYFIDPYKQGNNEWYQIYYKKDYVKPLNERMHCEFSDQDDVQEGGISLHEDLPQLKISNKTFGTEKRDYRLALACTMEYAAAVGGPSPTKASVLSAMVTTMNRVNGVFEKEFAMKCTLIGNTDDLIYLPGGSDPYSNTNGSTMLGQNQTTVNNIIGSANYDIGHVFSTGGGGIASLGCVCSNFNKAQGVTGSSNPVGDSYDIDYVAHEMGHQFGGSHTFNSPLGSCNGNRSSSSAYEPGSGTTIMAYAGICSSDNIQNHSDDYYHVRSLNQMATFMEGNGNCATKTLSANTPPNPALPSQTYYIPYKTPFELEGNAIDADGDPITYCWEEYDRGSQGEWDAITTTAPIFRSFLPTVSKIRTFPFYDALVANTIKYKGEYLADVQRNTSFKLTARDIRNGYGTFNYTETDQEVEVIDTGVPFKVTSHATGTISWTGDTKQTVTWDVASTNSGQINTPTVDIYFSTDSGRTFPYLMAANTPNDGSEDVYAPNLNASGARIKVKGHDNIFFDLNDKWIQLVQQQYPASLNEVDNKVLTVFPNPAKSKVEINLTGSQIASIELVSLLGSNLKRFEPTSTVLDLSHISAGIYFLRVKTMDNAFFVHKLVVQ